MKDKIAPVKNLLRLAELGLSLKDRSISTPGIGVVYGDTGFGKTTGLAWYGVRQERAVYVRALQLWTPLTMLETIAGELDVQTDRSLAKTLTRIVSELVAQNRMLIVDEADYVVGNVKLLNTLRDVHDLSTMPVVLVGMADFVKKLRTRMDQRQFSGRVAFELEFKPLDLDDTRLLAKELLDDDVKIDDALLTRLHDACEGSARLVRVGLARIEAFARKKNLRKVTEGDWGAQALHLREAGVRQTRIASDSVRG